MTESNQWPAQYKYSRAIFLENPDCRISQKDPEHEKRARPGSGYPQKLESNGYFPPH